MKLDFKSTITHERSFLPFFSLGGHQVVCRRCFVKTIQSAVAQRLLPLRCVICRARINRLTSSSGSFRLQESSSSYSVGCKSWSVRCHNYLRLISSNDANYNLSNRFRDQLVPIVSVPTRTQWERRWHSLLVFIL